MIFTHSCDPSGCIYYVIENKTDRDLEIVEYIERGKVKTNEIYAFEEYIEFSQCATGLNGNGDRRTFIDYRDKDSIQVKSKGILLKTYYPDDKGKNIFRTDDNNSWRLVENRSNYEKYVFEITEEDLK